MLKCLHYFRKLINFQIPAFVKMFTPTDTPSPRRPLPLSSTPMVTPVNPPPKATSQSCRPRPLFQEEPETFSTKKEKRVGGLFRPPPPRPPAKSCPPKSRVFINNSLLKAQAVSFNDTTDKLTVTGTPLHSSVYDTNKAQSYLIQAFNMEAEVGAGYFGEWSVSCNDF